MSGTLSVLTGIGHDNNHGAVLTDMSVACERQVMPRCTPSEVPMKITAVVRNSMASHEVVIRTGTSAQSLSIPLKALGKGSAVNGGEFLMLALATCYCNDLYREAERLGVPIERVEVEASAEFPGIGLAATNIKYRATVSSSASSSAVGQLLRETDAVAEIHNTVRAGVPVELVLQ